MDFRFSDGGTSVEWDYKVDGAPGQPHVLYIARDIRRERTGTHARVGIACATDFLGFDVFNIGRNEERTRLARSAHGQLRQQVRDAYPLEHMRRDLDLFCLGLEHFWNTRIQPEVLDGQEISATQFLVPPYLIEGAGTILFAPPGQGKSYIMMLMAISLQQGITMLWDIPEPRNVLLVNLERSKQSVARRIARINLALGLGQEAALHTLNYRGHSLQELEHALRETIQRESYDVLFLDSISRTAQGSLNDDTTATGIVNLLNSLSPTWFAIGHSPRQDSEHVFGSVHFDAGTDVAVKLESAPELTGMAVRLTITKANDIRKPAPQTVFLEFDETGLIEVRRASEEEFPALMAEGESSRLERVMDYLKRVGEATTIQIAQETGVKPSNVSHVLHSRSFVRVRQEGRQVYYGVAETPATHDYPDNYRDNDTF